MAPSKKTQDAPDVNNLFPDPKDSFYLRIPQYILDLCQGDLLEALLLAKLTYWTTFEYKDRIRRNKKASAEDIPIQRSVAQLVGDCLGVMSPKTARKKLATLEARGFLRSERSRNPHSNQDQATTRFLNVQLLQKLALDWSDPESDVRRTRFMRGWLEVKNPEGIWTAWTAVSENAQGDLGKSYQGTSVNVPTPLGKSTEVPGQVYLSLNKEEVKDTPKGGKDSQSRDPGGTQNENHPGSALQEEDRWIIEGVDFSPGSSHFHGNCLDQCNTQDLHQILQLLKLTQEFGYGIVIPGPGKRPSENFLTVARILREYEQRTWTPEFTPAFAAAWGVPESVGGPRGWEGVSADLRAAFTYDLAQKAGENRNPGPFLRFLESQVGDAGTASQFWVSLVKVRRSQVPVGPSAVLREQVGDEVMLRLSNRFQAAPDRPRDPRVFWERCLSIQEHLKTHRPGIKVHAALVGGWFRSHPVEVPAVLSLYDEFCIASGSRDPGDPGTGWPPVADDWESFVAWGRSREPAESFDLTFRPTGTEQDAEETRKAQDAERCFSRWRDDPALYVAEDVAQDVVEAAGFHIKQLSAPMLVHVVRLMQAKKMCTTKPSGLHLRALVSEASREPSPKIAAQEEAAWALLGVTYLDAVRSHWEMYFPDKMDIPEASLFPNSDT